MPPLSGSWLRSKAGRRLVVLALPLAVALSCDGRTIAEPAGTVGRRYALSHFDGAPLPVFWGVAGADSLWIVAETLTFSSEAQAMDAVHFAAGLTGASTSPLVIAGLHAYTLSGDSVQVGTHIFCFTLPCPVTLRSGTISEMELVLEHEGVHEYRFARIPPP